MAERLRRSTRNRLGLSRVGSSPAGVVFAKITIIIILLLFIIAFVNNLRQVDATTSSNRLGPKL